jgi:hydroxyethylthiazole kinase-like uncharacterized protein yjeF
MKIATAEQTRAWDAYTIEHEPIASLDLMERAVWTFTDWFVETFPDTNRKVVILCGPGNNGGDGLVAARRLAKSHYEVEVILLQISAQLSPDAAANLERLKEIRTVPISTLKKEDPFPTISENAYVIDAIFGSGLNRPVSGYWGTFISYLNGLDVARISIDIPSGLFADQATNGVVFAAHHTLSFERPKLSFFLPQGGKEVANWEVRSIGLHPDFLPQIPDTYNYSTIDELAPLLRPRGKFDHKGTYGHALIAAGSRGKVGAALLSAKACLRAGAGLVTIHAPKCAYEILQIGFPEAMTECDSHEFILTGIEQLHPYQAIGVGPGIGTNSLTERALYDLLTRATVPLVLDADALNILSRHYEWLDELPSGSILTPHPGEFKRLVGPTRDGFEQLQKVQELAMMHSITVVLKGAHTAIVTPEGQVYFNTTGNPGMGTGGSGDVLTGILTGLLAQGYSSKEACLLGVYLHGLAGDLAAAEEEQESLLASDLIARLGKAFHQLRILNGL